MPRTPDAVRQLGLLYEVIGVVVVVIEIRKASSRHQLPPLGARISRYWRAVPLVSSSTTLSVSGSVHAASSAEASLSLGWAVLGDATVEKRVAQLEQRATAVEAQQVAMREDFTREKKRTAAALQKEAADREAAVAALTERMKEAETGGLDLSLFGVSWLLIGMLMTTGTQEICRWLLRCS